MESVPTGNSSSRSATIDTASVEVSRAMIFAKRIFFSIINTSTAGQVITITFAQAATNGAGIVLSPGGYYAESKSDTFNPTDEQINAISSAAGGSVAITERIHTPGANL